MSADVAFDLGAGTVEEIREAPREVVCASDACARRIASHGNRRARPDKFIERFILGKHSIYPRAALDLNAEKSTLCECAYDLLGTARLDNGLAFKATDTGNVSSAARWTDEERRPGLVNVLGNLAARRHDRECGELRAART